MQEHYRQEMMDLGKLYSNVRLFAWVMVDANGSSCYLTEHAKAGKKDVKIPINHQLLKQNHIAHSHLYINSARILNAES